MQKITPAPDVAVLCCIPLDADRWMEVATQRPHGDFVRFNTNRLKTSVSGAWSAFAGEASFVSRKLESIEKRGMQVVRAATATDIALAATRHRNIVLIAHWKGMELPSDSGLPSARLETYDAMIAAAEFASLFPDDFAGTVYLIVCTSDIPAETFRRKHPDAICICSSESALAGLSLAKLDAALKLMQANNLPLWKALLQAADLIDSISR
ncbi:hypothetical protein [Citrobacter enshiensis]|uniref:hypothetical protein n=1 Tax=Citrobacter enshiensis TaxID=2971264 RepID=UPI0023E84C49|nr:hypothetical protein [Citrobacter enshiensis]WET39284.1 hypothetical protein P2W74_14965 [Citrobacter enshiensis]